MVLTIGVPRGVRHRTRTPPEPLRRRGRTRSSTATLRSPQVVRIPLARRRAHGRHRVLQLHRLRQLHHPHRRASWRQRTVRLDASGVGACDFRAGTNARHWVCQPVCAGQTVLATATSMAEPAAFLGVWFRSHGTHYSADRQSRSSAIRLPYRVPSSLRPDALPADPDDLIRTRGRGWLSELPLGDQTPRAGLPLATRPWMDTGVEVLVATSWLELAASVTNGSLEPAGARARIPAEQIAGRAAFKCRSPACASSGVSSLHESRT